tara:strand:- start:1535 stop:2491 length:957 start_codon:yes stop_codon:yes gene_type:complete
MSNIELNNNKSIINNEFEINNEIKDIENQINNEDEKSISSQDSDFLKVEKPDILVNKSSIVTTPRDNPMINRRDDDDEWIKIDGWYNELNFYSKVYQYFGEIIKDKEGMFGWWIILISSFSSFITLISLEPFNLTIAHNVYYNWGKSVLLAFLSLGTTLIAAWVKKKGYMNRIQIIDKRINRLEKFLGKIDYQLRLVPYDKRDDYFQFIAEMRDEYTELSIYTDILRPAEFTYTVYLITRFNSPMIRNTWPWYDTVTKEPRRAFAQNIINTYERQYSFWTEWLPCEPNIDEYNPLLYDIECKSKENKKNKENKESNET